MRNKYIIETSLLRKGDIILTSDNTKISKGIRLSTLSRYSHASIWVGGTLIEATRAGVFSKNPQRLLFDRPQDCMVLRSKKDITETDINHVCDFARSKVGSLYAFDEAIFISALRSMKKNPTNKQFCSRLVALAYNEIKFDFINLPHPAYCTPGQLKRCKAFAEVSDMIRPARAEEIDFASSFDPVRKNQADTFEWLGNVRLLVKSDKQLETKFDIQTINDTIELLISRPDLDNTISGFIKETDYLTFFDHDVKINPYRYNYIEMINKLKTCDLDSKCAMIHREIEKENGITHNHPKNMSKYCDIYNKHKLNTLADFIELTGNILLLSKERLTILDAVSKELGIKNSTTDNINYLLAIIEDSLALKNATLSS